MPLQPDQRIAHYRVVEKIGEGGMGEVYLAEDTKLGRSVALKVLPAEFVRDETRLTRFAREAQILASLNHPNIATIHGLEEAGDITALALELVEGETLAERIGRGPLSSEEAASIALQIAEALEAAHDKGIIHRDLKPANVKFAADGRVKVLDFGLAKALTREGAEQDMSFSPTMTAAATQAGMIMGTASYMSPEQARGKPVDRRADIWAFGCVLYEMLTGRKPFAGEDVTEVLAHVITGEPDLDRLPRALPGSLRDLIRRCLRKDPRMRLPDIGAARIALMESRDAGSGDAGTETAAPAGAGPGSSLLQPAIAGVMALAMGLLLGWMLWSGAPPAAPDALNTHLDLALDPPLGKWNMAISPDGGTVVYTGLAGGKKQLYRRDLSGFNSQAIPGTEGGRWPFFSPDGRKIGFVAAGRLKITTLQGGLPEPVCGVPGEVSGSIWTADDRIIYSTIMLSVPHRVSASGGEPQPLELEGMKPGMRVTSIAALPGGAAFLATLIDPSKGGPRVVVVDPEDGRMETVVRGHSAQYVEPGTLLFLQQDRLMAAPFDVATRKLTGPERPSGLDAPAVDRPPLHETEARIYTAAAENGTLLYLSGEVDNTEELHWLSRDGTLEPVGVRGWIPQVNGTGDQAVALGDDDMEVWLVDLQEGERTRLTFTGDTIYPRWSRDGKQVVFARRKKDGYAVLSLPLSGGGEPRLLLDESEELPSIFPTSTHPDGRTLVYAVHPETNRDIWILDDAGEAQPILRTGANERAGALSPDADLFAYVSDEDGPDRIFIREFPDTGRRWPVTDGESRSPVWSRDGSELFFIAGDAILVVPVQWDGRLRIGEPVEVFRSERLRIDDWGNTTFDSAPDGRLLVSLSEPSDLRPRILVNGAAEVMSGR